MSTTMRALPTRCLRLGSIRLFLTLAGQFPTAVLQHSTDLDEGLSIETVQRIGDFGHLVCTELMENVHHHSRLAIS